MLRVFPLSRQCHIYIIINIYKMRFHSRKLKTKLISIWIQLLQSMFQSKVRRLANSMAGYLIRGYHNVSVFWILSLEFIPFRCASFKFISQRVVSFIVLHVRNITCKGCGTCTQIMRHVKNFLRDLILL